MVGRRPLVALAASTLLLVGIQSPALAAGDDGIPFEQLVQVYVPDQAAVDNVVSHYDAATPTRRRTSTCTTGSWSA